MKKLFCLIVALILVLSLVACGGSGSSNGEAKATTLSYSMALPTSHKYYTYDNQWIEKVTELSDGTITINPHWAGSLVAATSSYAELTAGVCDIVNAVPGNELEHFVVDTVVQYFYWGMTDLDDLLEVTQQIWDSNEAWRKEYAGTQKLTFGTSGIAYLLSTKEVNSLEDLKGMTIRAQCDVGYELVSYFGGSPVKMALGTVYESLSSGTIDAVLIPVDAYESLQLADICPYIYYFDVAEPWYVHKYISEKSWNKLSADQQTALIEASDYRQNIELTDTEAYAESALKYAQEHGVEVRYFTDAEYEQIHAACEAIALAKVAELDAKGYDGTGMYNEARAIVDSYLNK